MATPRVVTLHVSGRAWERSVGVLAALALASAAGVASAPSLRATPAVAPQQPAAGVRALPVAPEVPPPGPRLRHAEAGPGAGVGFPGPEPVAVAPAAVTQPPTGDGIPARVLQAYLDAAGRTASEDPSCALPWWLLAGIGRVESGHAARGRVDGQGRTTTRILGPRLDGTLAGTRVITDGDGGALDGDVGFDRAVGPMQFLPGTWRGFGADADADGVADPHDVDDAALAAARYLCAGSAELSSPAGMSAAVLRYNRSTSYLRTVLGWGHAYRDGVRAVPATAGPLAPALLLPAPTPEPPPAPPQPVVVAAGAPLPAAGTTAPSPTEEPRPPLPVDTEPSESAGETQPPGETQTPAYTQPPAESRPPGEESPEPSESSPPAGCTPEPEPADPTEPTETDSTVTDPVLQATEPVVTEPVVTGPVVTGPVVTGPVVTEPPTDCPSDDAATEEPPADEPSTAEAAADEPSTAEPAVHEGTPSLP